MKKLQVILCMLLACVMIWLPAARKQMHRLIPAKRKQLPQRKLTRKKKRRPLRKLPRKKRPQRKLPLVTTTRMVFLRSTYSR